MPVLSSETAVTAAPRIRACATHCPYCSLQCGMHIEADANAVWTITERNFPTNRGGLYQKGWSSAELLSNPERLLTPLMRDSRAEPWRPAAGGGAGGRGARARGET